MNNGLIAARYATALLEFAQGSKSAETVYQEAKTIVRSYEQHGSLGSVLDNPVLTKTDKKKVISLAAGGKMCASLDKFVDLLFEKNREIHLQAIMLRYLELYRKQQHIHSGKLVTATEVSAAIEKKLVALVEQQTGGKLEIEKILNPSILGGFQLEVDYVRWDASLSGQLQRIKKEYIEKNKRVL